MKCRMDKIESQVMPSPPNLIAALRAGFDAVANQIIVITIPIFIDLILWLGPHIQIKILLSNVLKSMASTAELSSIQTGDMLTSSVEVIKAVAEQFNLLSLIRTIPVGIPSLMAARLPVEIPNGLPKFIEITNILAVIGIVICVMILGLVLGCLYYIFIGQIALQGRIAINNLIRHWSWSSMQVVSLALALFLLFIVISIPASCAITALSLFGLQLGQFAVFLYIGVLLWLAFPLLFAAHGIFVYHLNAITSVQRSLMLTRMTLPTTSLFILSVLLISEGLDLLWRVPPEKSWLTLVGVVGHAFVTSALLAASFVYYRDADQWTQETLRMLKSKRDSLSHSN
jgi:hypothetical protein